MQSRAWTVASLVGVAVLAGAAAVVAQPPHRAMRGTGGPGEAGEARYLGLTTDQQAQLEQLREARRPQAQALGKQLHENHQRLQEALEVASPDPAAIGAIVIEGHELQQQMRKLHEDADAALRALLTPEQQAKFDALQALRRERGPMGRAPFAPPPGEQP